MVGYIYSSLPPLTVESRTESQGEIKLLLLLAEQIHKMTTVFTQNGPG